MRPRTVLLLATLACTGCHHAMTATTRTTVTDGVRQFARDVEHDVTREGPAAWRRHFSQAPSFFMASNGQLVFTSGTSAAHGIDDLTRSIKAIELRWGDDLRVDPLTADLAVLAGSWSERRTATDGSQVTDRGYFTAVTERHDGHWRFRDAHWSVLPPEAKAPAG